MMDGPSALGFQAADGFSLGPQDLQLTSIKGASSPHFPSRNTTKKRKSIQTPTAFGNESPRSIAVSNSNDGISEIALDSADVDFADAPSATNDYSSQPDALNLYSDDSGDDSIDEQFHRSISTNITYTMLPREDVPDRRTVPSRKSVKDPFRTPHVSERHHSRRRPQPHSDFSDRTFLEQTPQPSRTHTVVPLPNFTDGDIRERSQKNSQKSANDDIDNFDSSDNDDTCDLGEVPKSSDRINTKIIPRIQSPLSVHDVKAPMLSSVDILRHLDVSARSKSTQNLNPAERSSTSRNHIVDSSMKRRRIARGGLAGQLSRIIKKRESDLAVLSHTLSESTSLHDSFAPSMVRNGGPDGIRTLTVTVQPAYRQMGTCPTSVWTCHIIRGRVVETTSALDAMLQGEIVTFVLPRGTEHAMAGRSLEIRWPWRFTVLNPPPHANTSVQRPQPVLNWLRENDSVLRAPLPVIFCVHFVRPSPDPSDTNASAHHIHTVPSPTHAKWKAYSQSMERVFHRASVDSENAQSSNCAIPPERCVSPFRVLQPQSLFDEAHTAENAPPSCITDFNQNNKPTPPCSSEKRAHPLSLLRPLHSNVRAVVTVVAVFADFESMPRASFNTRDCSAKCIPHQGKAVEGKCYMLATDAEARTQDCSDPPPPAELQYSRPALAIVEFSRNTPLYSGVSRLELFDRLNRNSQSVQSSSAATIDYAPAVGDCMLLDRFRVKCALSCGEAPNVFATAAKYIAHVSAACTLGSTFAANLHDDRTCINVGDAAIARARTCTSEPKSNRDSTARDPRRLFLLASAYPQKDSSTIVVHQPNELP